MPGPPPLYPNNAARQRAYRQRKHAAEQEERSLAEATVTYAYALQEAVQAAGRRENGLAREVYRADPLETLRALIDHFYDQAGTPAEDRPWWGTEGGVRLRPGDGSVPSRDTPGGQG